MLDKLLKTEVSKASMVILLTLLAVLPIIIIRLFSEFATLALIMFGLVVLGMVVSYWYSRRSRVFEGLSYDERTEKFALKAMRNGFIMAVAISAILAVITGLGGQIGAFDMLIWVYGWTITIYMLSLLYYIWKG